MNALNNDVRDGQGERSGGQRGTDGGLVSVLVAYGQPIVREYVAAAIAVHERLSLVDEVGDGAAALERLNEQSPNAMVLDVAMPVLDGAGVLRRLRERRMATRVLLLPGHASAVQMRDALAYRPDSLLTMDVGATEVCEELLALEHGRELSAGQLNVERARLLSRNSVELSTRERDVLQLSAEGLTRAEMGERLCFGPSTVRDIRRDICTKLGAPSMQVAIVVAIRSGLLE